MITNKRAWLALKSALWWCVTSLLHMWSLNPISIIRRRHAKLYYLDTDYNDLAKPRWTDVVCNIILPGTKRKALLLKWVQEMAEGVIIDNFTDSWHDGMALCSLIEGVSPGSCPQLKNLKPEYSKSNCQLGIKLAQKYLSQQKIFITPDIMATASPETEKYILHLVQLIKWRYQGCLASKPTNEKSSSIKNSKINVYEARGLGLTSATVGKRATFTIYTENNDSLDLNIEIRGPNNERNCEKITRISPNDVRTCRVERHEAETQYKHRDRRSSFHYMKDSEGNTVIRQRSVEEDSTNIIPFDYQFKDDQSFLVAYVPNSVGLYIIDIFSHGESIQGSPFEVVVTNRMTSWDKVTKKKLMMLNSRTYVEEVDRDESLRTDALTEGCVAKLDQPRLLRQFTVTKKRVIKRTITRNGQEIVITDHNSSPGTSRGSSVDIADSEHSDTDWPRKRRSSGMHSRDDANKTFSKTNCLTARPFSPDNVSLCSFSRRSSGAMSDSNTSSSSGRHGEVSHTDTSADIKTTESIHIPEQKSPKPQTQDNEEKTATACRGVQLETKHVQKALTYSFGSKQSETGPSARRSSEQYLPSMSLESVNNDAKMNSTLSEHQSAVSKENEKPKPHLTEKISREFHKDYKSQENKENIPIEFNLSCPSVSVDDAKENEIKAVRKVPPSSKRPAQRANLQTKEVVKRSDSLNVKKENKHVFNEGRPPHISTCNIELKRSKPNCTTDKWTQVTADEIKSETNWKRRVVRRRRRIPCSSPEDMAIKIKEYHLKMAERQALKENVHQIDKTENYGQFGYHKKTEKPSCRIQRWLQSNHLRRSVRPARQLTKDSGISDEGQSEHSKSYPNKVSRVTKMPSTNESYTVMNTAIVSNAVNNDDHSSVAQSESSTNVFRKHSESNGSVSVSDSELQCAPSILKQKRKLFAKTKYLRQEMENMDPDTVSKTSRNKHASGTGSALLRRRLACIQPKTQSLPRESSGLSNGSENRTESEFITKRVNNLPHKYADNKHQVFIDKASNLQQVSSDNIPEHQRLDQKNLVICIDNIPYKSQPSVVSTPEEGYDGFGLLAEKRDDFLNEIRAFQDLALTDNVKSDNQHHHTTTPTAPRRENTVIQNIFENIKTKSGCDTDTESLTFLSHKESKELVSHPPVHWFGMSGQSTSVDTETSFPNDVLDKSDDGVQGYATDDDYWASSEISEACIASGFGLKYGYVGIQNNFQVWVVDPEVGNLMVGVRGPRPHSVTETSTTYTGDNLYEITYSVTMPGLYLIFIKWNNTPLSNSPFIVKIACINDENVDDD